MKLRNEVHLKIADEITNLLNLGKLTTIVSREKEKVEKIDIPPTISIPSKISYALIKNRSKVKSIQKQKEDIIEDIREEYKSEVKFDESKYSQNKEYAKTIDEGLINRVQTSKVMEEFEKDEVDIDYYIIKLTEGESDDPNVYSLSDLDPDNKFDLIYLPEVLVGTIIELV